MKADKMYHCFACGVGGDAIDFTARLFGLLQYEAAKKLVEDFGLDIKVGNRSKYERTPRNSNVINLRKFQKNVDKFIKKCGEAFLNEYISGG